MRFMREVDRMDLKGDEEKWISNKQKIMCRYHNKMFKNNDQEGSMVILYIKAQHTPMDLSIRDLCLKLVCDSRGKPNSVECLSTKTMGMNLGVAAEWNNYREEQEWTELIDILTICM